MIIQSINIRLLSKTLRTNIQSLISVCQKPIAYTHLSLALTNAILLVSEPAEKTMWGIISMFLEQASETSTASHLLGVLSRTY